MTRTVRKTLAVTAAAVALGIGLSAPANAAPNDANQRGLVNLALQDTTVQVPIAVAADICGVAVNVLATSAGLPVDCTATGVVSADRPAGGPDNARQRGLVNVAVQDTTVQVPVAVAANVCGVAVNVITGLNLNGPVTCDALAEAAAAG